MTQKGCVAVEPVCVKTFAHRYQAEMAQQLLTAAGITSFISSDDCGGMYPPLAFGMEGFRLMVREEDGEKALRILEGERE